ncbi:MAG: sensor histidine kinase [Actinomycetota bacterium]
MSKTDEITEVAALTRSLLQAETGQDAVRAAAGFCHGRFGQPVAGWMVRTDPARLELVSAHGLGPPERKDLQTRLGTIRRGDLLTETGRRRAASGFAATSGLHRAEVVVAGEVAALAGAAKQPSFPAVGSLLANVLEHLEVVHTAARRNERLDLGIALTAHEVRSPLLGAMAIMDRLLMTGQQSDEDRGLIRRSRDQLRDLSRLVDGMLRWAVAGEPLRKRRTDLVRLVREAVATLTTEATAHRVEVSAPARLVVPAAGTHLRSAVVNVVQNALEYSPPESLVSVNVEPVDGLATVTVKDRGRGVPPEEGDSIFDPFMRGSAAEATRGGKGLGLFIARRVMTAHGGSVYLSPGGGGATFVLQLPLAAERRSPSAS